VWDMATRRASFQLQASRSGSVLAVQVAYICLRTCGCMVAHVCLLIWLPTCACLRHPAFRVTATVLLVAPWSGRDDACAWPCSAGCGNGKEVVPADWRRGACSLTSDVRPSPEQSLSGNRLLTQVIAWVSRVSRRGAQGQ